METVTEEKKMHIAMFPWLAFGHMIPFLELGKKIAIRGHKISFLAPPKNLQRLPKIPPHLTHLVDFIPLPLPHVENLAPQAQATSDLPFNQIPLLKIAFDGLKHSLEDFLASSAPDWIIYDFAPHWLPPITSRLGIPGAYFTIFHAYAVCATGPSSAAIMNGEDPRTKPEDFTVPPPWVPFPSVVAFRIHEARRFFDHIEVNPSGVSDMFRVGSVLAGCDAVASRGIFEVEGQYISLLGELHKKPSLPVGLLPPVTLVACRQEEEDETWKGIKKWLDQKEKGRVIYIALGSELNLSQPEVDELALGLELTGLPFFWVLRKQLEPVVELPSGFEERVEGRGMMWTSWAPQLKIMSHDSVGGFLTHCGLSSIVEAIYYKRPLIMLPFGMDQGFNARVMEEKRVGVEVPRKEDDGSFSREAVAETARLVVVEEEGKVYRDKAAELSLLFSDEDLDDSYIDAFVAFLLNLLLHEHIISYSCNYYWNLVRRTAISLFSHLFYHFR